MFGYIKPFKPEMKIREFEEYKSVYCGLCARLGKVYGPAARLCLSYDFAFLAALYIGVAGDMPGTTRPCRANPFCRAARLSDCTALSFSADVTAIAIYYKLLDDISDSGAVKSMCLCALKPLASSARKKAALKQPEADRFFCKLAASQKKAELAETRSLDEAGEPTALLVSGLFGLLPAGGNQSRVLKRLGYLLGRYMYIADAFDDVYDDFRQKSYNPLIAGEPAPPGAKALDRAKESLYMTIGEITRAYDLLELKHFKPVIDNIIYFGLYRCVDAISNRHLNQKKGSVK